MKSKLWITLGFFLMAGAGVFGAFFYTKYYFQSPKAGRAVPEDPLATRLMASLTILKFLVSMKNPLGCTVETSRSSVGNCSNNTLPS